MISKLLEVSLRNPFWSPFIQVNCESKDDKTKGKPGKPDAGKPAAGKGGKGKKDQKEEPKIVFGTPEYYAMCALGGAICCGVTHLMVTPLDLVKCRIQTDPEKYPGLWKGLKVTKQEGGVRG